MFLRKRVPIVTGAIALLFLAFAFHSPFITPSDASTHMEREYTVTLENLTPATGQGASQPLSPPVVFTHATNYRLFHIGGHATEELRYVAEDAINGPLLSELNGSDAVFDVAVGNNPILPGTSSPSFKLTAKRGNHKLTLVSMLVNTNDGFVAAEKVNLPEKGTKTYRLRSYDAGTEKNTELEAHIPGPCCGNPEVRVPTDERISFHEGIQGVGDLDPDIYDWDEPAAKLTITRTK